MENIQVNSDPHKFIEALKKVNKEMGANADDSIHTVEEMLADKDNFEFFKKVLDQVTLDQIKELI